MDANRNSPLLWTLRLLVIAVLGMATLLALVPAAGHDQLWFLLMGQRWLHGATLYGPETFDSNTPAAVWASAIPAGLAGLTGTSMPAMGKLLVVLLEGFIAVFLLKLQPGLRQTQKLFFAFAFITLFGAAAARDFGQRDQLAGLLLLPYVVLASQSTPRNPARISAGVLAGIGCCIKPQLSLVPLLIEAALLLINIRQRKGRLRSLQRPEPYILIAVGVSFLLAIKTFTPLYFSLTLPTLLASYWAIGHLTPPELFLAAIQLHILAVIALGLWLLDRKPLTAALLIAGFGALLSYYVQGTGWYYQQLPGIGFFGLAIALQLVALTKNWNPRLPHWTPFAAAALTLLALTLTIHFSGYPFSREMFSDEHTYALETIDPTFFNTLPPGTPVATLTTSVEDAMMPVFRYHLTWAQRTNNLWMLPATFRESSPHGPQRLTPQRLRELSTQQRTWMVEDLNRWRPTLILVARCQDPAVTCQELEGRHDDLLAFFQADPAFGQLWQRYHFVRRSGSYDAYELTSP